MPPSYSLSSACMPHPCCHCNPALGVRNVPPAIERHIVDLGKGRQAKGVGALYSVANKHSQNANTGHRTINTFIT